MGPWTRVFCLLLLVSGLSSSPLGSMEQAAGRESASASVLASRARATVAAAVGEHRLPDGRHRSPLVVPVGEVGDLVARLAILPDDPAPDAVRTERVALIGYRATAPPAPR
jgi:hypothetical protein